MKWQPIETIPENELVMVYSLKWGHDWCRKVGKEFYVGDGPIFSHYPTHWMPLPPPPPNEEPK